MMKKISWGVMTFLAFGIVFVASRYFTLNPDVFFPQQRDVYISQQLGIMTHIAGGVVALAFGPFQFLPRLRANRPQIHRWLGRIYMAGILFGGMAGLYMATFAFGGIISTIGFGSLAVVWLITGYMAFTSIRNGQVEAHQAWMIRNFALTFAAVTLRIEMPFLIMGFSEVTGYQIVAYLCWIPNLIVAEGIIQGWFGRKPNLESLSKSV